MPATFATKMVTGLENALITEEETEEEEDTALDPVPDHPRDTEDILAQDQDQEIEEEETVQDQALEIVQDTLVATDLAHQEIDLPDAHALPEIEERDPKVQKSEASPLPLEMIDLDHRK
jgi:hypothetical protein